jgi:NhaA family Na+:H+ antiporter
VHATLAGVALAFAIPLKGNDGSSHSPLHHLEHSLHPWVAFAILPIFAFANAGVPLEGLSVGSLFQRVPLGILLGLLVGKQVGVFGFSWLTIKLGLAELPEHASSFQLFGVSTLCGVGFTMSLFIGSLAFEHTGGDYLMTYRIGILAGSLIAAVLGYVILRVSLKNKPSEKVAR